MEPSRILVNAVSLSGGALTRERHILDRLDTYVSDVEVHVLAPGTERTNSTGEDIVFHDAEHPDGTLGRIAWENTALPWSIERLGADVLYFPLHITNVVGGCPKVSAVRNVAPFYPEAHREASWRERRRLSVLRAATRRTISQSERVVFMSRTTMDRVAADVPAASDKGVVIPHGIPDRFEPMEAARSVVARYDLPDSFLLSVSNVAPYKNLVELVDGYARASTNADLPPLCLAGKVVDERYAREVRSRIEAHGLDEEVRFLGYVDHDDLPAVHAASDMFVFSSACENAPISLLEALGCGDAIASSQAASMPEICGDAAAYFDPYDPSDIADTIGTLWDDPDRRRTLGERALDRAEQFDWERTARETGRLLSGVAR